MSDTGQIDDGYDDTYDDVVDEVGAEGNRIEGDAVSGAHALAVTEYVTRNLADDPDAIEVDVEERGDEVALMVRANPSDMGRLIGKRGRVIQALRQLVRAAGTADGVKANVDIVESRGTHMVTPGAGDRLVVGRVGRAHGLRGEVAVTFSSNRPERSAPGAVLFAGDRALVVTASRPHQGRVLLRFAGVDDRTAAEALLGVELTAEPLAADVELDERELWVHEVVGAEVLDRAGTVVGTVTAVEANPAHDLLVLDGGALVPMVFVVEQRDGVVVIDPPDGLFDL